MVLRGRLQHRMAKAVAGILLALFWLELTHIFITPSIVPSWFTKVMAATDVIDPDGNGVGSGTLTATTCGAGGNFDCVNDAVRDPTAPSTAGDYLEIGNASLQSFLMGTVPGVQEVTAVSVKVYHLDNPTNGRNNMQMTVSLWNAAETVEYGTAVQFLNRNPAQWDTANFSSLSLTQAELDGLRVRLQCDRVGGGQPESCRTYAMYADITYEPAVNLDVSTIGTQQDVVAGDTNAYIGGSFVFNSVLGSRSVTSITIAETGSIDAQANINNVKLFYDLDTTLPYDCASESYSGTESQFGATVTGGFNAANGTASFFDTVGISTTQALCVYVVLDVANATPAGETILVQITDPSTNVTGSAGSIVGPATPVILGGTTTVNKAEVRQTAYHWRLDDGSETAASSATAGAENTVYEDFPKGDNVRLRMGVTNNGTATSDPQQFRLEYAERVTTCDVASGWTDVGAAGGDFDMSPTANLTDGNDTTNVAIADGGVSDPAGKTFLTPNGGVRDTTSQTGNITLTSAHFTELEYSIIADPALVEGSAYCFRLTDAGTVLNGYDNYAQLVVAADVRISSIGSLPGTVGIPQTNYYVGGAFTIRENSSSRTVDSITVTHTGTADGQVYLSNVKLFYDVDTTSPYDCNSESFAGTEAQYGATAASFNAPQGTATFTGSVNITTTQAMCVYVVVDISENATTNDTISFSIAGGGSDVTLSSGSASPLSAVAIASSTVLLGSETEQYAYHWRNNDGSETGASSATGGTANTQVIDYTQEDPIRLRIGLNNISAVDAPARTYRLEYGVRVTTCDAVGVWQAAGPNADWTAYDSAELTHNSNTTNIAIANGGIADIGGKAFSGTNGVRTTEAQTASVAVLTTNFYEFEFSLRSSSTAQFLTTYCFRLARVDGTPLESYAEYPTLRTVERRDFRVQRGSVDVSGTGLTLTAGSDYVAPKSTSTGFVRITGVSQTGSGPNQNSIDSSAAITMTDLTTDFTIARPTGAAGTTRVTWELVDFIAEPGTDNETQVRDVDAFTFTSGTTVLNGPTVDVADDSRVVVYVTGVHSNVAGRDNYYEQQITSEWDAVNSRPVFRRGASSLATLIVSYAVVEYTGINWRVQRIEHTYTAAGTIETEDITQPLNNIKRSFTHIQKRMGAFNTVQSFGHRAWINSIGQASFELESGAATPSGHTTVMWIVENFQTSEGRMNTERQLGSTTGGTAPLNITVSMPAIEAVGNSSIFAVARSTDSGNNRNYPRPLAGFFINTTTSYQIWRGNTGSELFYATEVVEWPTHGLAIRQNYYRVYANNDALTPTDPWPVGPSDLGENMTVTADDEPLGLGERIRLRIALRTDNATWPQNLNQFILQYGERVTTCSAISSWTNVGASGSGEIWRLYDVSGVTNGQALSTNPATPSDLLLSVSTVAGVLSELQPTVPNPYEAEANDQVEFDWPVEQNGANPETTYCFRVIFSSNDPIDGYIFYPQIRTAGFTPSVQDWRWYDDADNETPSIPLSSANVTPNEIPNQNQIALRVTIAERKGVAESNVKYRLEYDQSPLFNNPQPVTASSSCTEFSVWCYADVPQVDNATISTALLTTSDACASSVGNGCGTHNTAPATASTFNHQAFQNAEFAFYIESRTARVGAVYYFRMVENNTGIIVEPFSSSTYPSVVSESSALVLTVDGLPAGTSTAGVVTDNASGPAAITFADFLLDDEVNVAHRVSIDTNASDGYRVLMRTRGPLANGGDIIDNVVATNETPLPWADACSLAAKSCIGYHTTDATLSGNSTRFALNDTYAALSTESEEIMYSPIPADDSHDIVYKLQVRYTQPPGNYTTEIVYIAMPMY